MSRSITFEEAKRIYPHRFTLEHVPAWSQQMLPDGRCYAPQYASDYEWYLNTFFPGESAMAVGKSCYSHSKTWPLGEWLELPYQSHPGLIRTYQLTEETFGDYSGDTETETQTETPTP